MVNITTKYVILIWIIILILFTFYCIFRIKYLKEKYYDTPNHNYFTNSDNTPIISLINSIEKEDNINNLTDPPQCKNLYDDNIKAQTLGYNNCQSAYSDYITKGYNVKNNYGQAQSLEEICPISSKSAMYGKCISSLLNKFTNNANMVNGITNDMTSSINQRLQSRNGVLDNIQNQLNPLIYTKDQNDFKTYMKTKNQVANYKDDVIGLVNSYYRDKYRGGDLGYTGGNIDVNSNSKEGFISRSSVYIIDPTLQALFFGNFKPINGQFLALNDLTLSLGYEGTAPTVSPYTYSEMQLDDNSLSTSSNKTIKSIELSQNSSNLLNQINNIILTINSKNNNLSIVYKIVNIDNYSLLPNAINIIISNQNIISNTNDAGSSQTILNLLSTLGITAPVQLIMTYEEFTSSEGILHKTYKLINDNLDTLLVMNKI